MNLKTRIYACTAGLAALLALLIGATSHSQTTSPSGDSYARGRALEGNYHLLRAKNEYDRAIIADPKNANAYFARARVGSNLLNKTNGDDPTPVLSDFDKALELEPTNRDFLYFRALFLLVELKDEKRGLENYAQLIKSEPKNASHYFVRGRFFSESKRYPEAIKDLSAAIDLGDISWLTRFLRARAYRETKSYRAALIDVNELIVIMQEQIGLPPIDELRMRSDIYRKLGNDSLADADEWSASQFKQRVIKKDVWEVKP